MIFSLFLLQKKLGGASRNLIIAVRYYLPPIEGIGVENLYFNKSKQQSVASLHLYYCM